MGGNPILTYILALGLVVGGIIAAYIAYNSANADSTAQNTSQYITMMMSNVQTDFANNPQNYTGFNNKAAIQAGIPPSTWVSTGQTANIVDPWVGQVVFAAANVNGGTANGYTLDIPSMPGSVCATDASMYTQQTASISVNGAVVASNPSYGGTATTWPPAPAAIQGACGNSSNEVIWTQSGQ